jgi:hypothetical protein
MRYELRDETTGGLMGWLKFEDGKLPTGYSASGGYNGDHLVWRFPILDEDAMVKWVPEDTSFDIHARSRYTVVSCKFFKLSGIATTTDPLELWCRHDAFIQNVEVLVPDMATAITAIRGWRIQYVGIAQELLTPVNFDSARYVLRPYQAAEARCVCKNYKYKEQCPFVPGSSCGWYGFKTTGNIPWRGLHEVIEYVANDITYDALNELVFGEMSMWGRYVEHEYGWRSQFIYPKCLGNRKLAHTYGVPYNPDYSLEAISCKLEKVVGQDWQSQLKTRSQFTSSPSRTRNPLRSVTLTSNLSSSPSSLKYKNPVYSWDIETGGPITQVDKEGNNV